MKKIIFTAIAIFGLATITMAQVPNYVPSNGLVGWWPFNGNGNDESGNGNNGTVNGTTLTSDRNGNANSAYSFNGVSDYIIIQNTLLSSTSSSLTISLWYETTDIGANFISDRYTGINYFKYFVGISGGQIVSGNYSSSCNNPVLSNVLNNNWSNLVIVKDLALNLNLIYLNGVLVNSNSGVCYHGSNNPTQIGRWGGGNDAYYAGKLDDIGFWNRALTICEIQDLYASQLNSTFVNAGTDQTICNGDPVTLSAINSLNYSWDNGVTDNVVFNPTATQDYTVNADSAGCLSTDVVTVTVNENTSATQIQTALDSYTWPINSQTYTQSGTYTAVIPNAAGCDSTITLDLSLDFTTGINEFSQDNLFSVYPNPAKSQINVKADAKLLGSIYTVYNNTGKLVLTGKIISENTTIELGNLSGGIYLFSVGENMKQTFKVIKE